MTDCVVHANWAANLGGSIRTAITAAVVLLSACSSAPHTHVRPVRGWDVTPPVDMSEIDEVSRPTPFWCPWEFEGDIMDPENVRDQWEVCEMHEGVKSPRCQCMGVWVNGPPP